MGRRRKGPRSECSVVIAVRIPKFDAELLDAVASAEGISRSDVFRWALAIWQESERETIRRATGG